MVIIELLATNRMVATATNSQVWMWMVCGVICGVICCVSMTGCVWIVKTGAMIWVLHSGQRPV